jgi:hypothetical protein
VAQDTENQLADRFREIRRAWDLRPGETETQAQNSALMPLHTWLRTGTEDLEVPLVAAQVLMVDPEMPAVHKRRALAHVFDQVSTAWKSAGFQEQDVLILRGMLLAAWPHELKTGGFALVPLLDSAWQAISGRASREKFIQEWRQQLLSPTSTAAAGSSGIERKDEAQQTIRQLLHINVADTGPITQTLKKLTVVQQFATVAQNTATALEAHHGALNALANQLNLANASLIRLDGGLSVLFNHVNTLGQGTGSQAMLLWWGQARYSHNLRIPYRRISDAMERLWWMTWDCAELAQQLEVEPAASFLVETLFQVDRTVDAHKRPLVTWVAEFIEALRRIRAQGSSVDALAPGQRLSEFAEDDLLGLPVTWARLEAAKDRPSPGALEEHLRTQVGLDPQALIDRGDWAEWVFREALLDQKLGDE